MDLNNTGKIIAKLRKAAGFTQASLAQKLGISDKAISKWERGIAFPDTSILNQLCILLDTDIESILYGYDHSEHWLGVLILDESIPSDIIIYNKPLIHYLISQFLLVGIKEIIIIGNCHPPNLDGINIKVVSKINQQFSKNIFVIYGNQFLYGPNLTKHFMRAMSRDSTTLIAGIKAKGEFGLEVDLDRKAVLSSKFNLNKYYALPYIFDSSKRKLFSFEKVMTERINVETLPRGMVHFNLNTFERVYQMAGFVSMMEDNSGEKIADLQEIIERRRIKE